MPNRRKDPEDRRNKGLTLTLREREYVIIENLSKHLGVTKTALVLSAIKKQYNKDALMNDCHATSAGQ